MKPRNSVAKQVPGGKGGSAPQRTSTGSGSRPGGSTIKIPSSNPSNPQRIRG